MVDADHIRSLANFRRRGLCGTECTRAARNGSPRLQSLSGANVHRRRCKEIRSFLGEYHARRSSAAHGSKQPPLVDGCFKFFGRLPTFSQTLFPSPSRFKRSRPATADRRADRLGGPVGYRCPRPRPQSRHRLRMDPPAASLP